MSTTTVAPRRDHTQSLVRRHPLISFYVLTYAIAWMLWAPLVILRGSIPGSVGFILPCWDPSYRPRSAWCSSASSGEDPACVGCFGAWFMAGSGSAGTWRHWPWPCWSHSRSA